LGATQRFATAHDRTEVHRLLGLSWQELIGDSNSPELKRMMNAALDDLAKPDLFAVKYCNPATSGGAALWVAEADGHLSGCVGVHKTNDFECELVRMVVDPKHRREGVGKMLVEQVAAYAKEHAYADIWLMCGSASGQALYHACGFRAVEMSSWVAGQLACRFVRAVQPYRFDCVLITGGVHGNELVGPALLQRWSGNAPEVIESHHVDVARKSLRTFTWLANPRAVEKAVRFIDRDLNRCFALGDAAVDGYETERARALLEVCPKEEYKGGAVGRGRFQMLVDLHSTASNMGMCLMAIAGSTFNLRLAKHVMRAVSSNPRYPVRLVLADSPTRAANNNIDSVTPLGIAIEVGPLVHGTYGDLELLDATQRGVHEIMNFLDAENVSGAAVDAPALDFTRHPSTTQKVTRVDSITAYVSYKPVHFPRDAVSGKVRAAIHPSLLGRDFCELKRGDPLFIDLETRETVRNDETEVTYPIFIAEPAYLAGGVAMVLTKKKEFVVY